MATLVFDSIKPLMEEFAKKREVNPEGVSEWGEFLEVGFRAVYGDLDAYGLLFGAGGGGYV